MKKHSSVLMFFVQNKIYKVLFVLLAMSVVSILGFRYSGFTHAPVFGANHGDWFLGGICLLGYAGCVLSCTEFSSAKSKRLYIYQRLRISEREILLWDMMTSILIFLVFYAVEIIILCTAAGMYAAAPGYTQGEQGMIAAFYRSSFLHGMIPMAERGLWIRNILYAIVTGTECACSSLNLRHNSRMLSTSFCLAAVVALRFPAEVGRESYIFTVIIVAVAIFSFVRTYKRSHNGKRRQEDEEENR